MVLSGSMRSLVRRVVGGVKPFLRWIYLAVRDFEYLFWRLAARFVPRPVRSRVGEETLYVRLEDWRAFRIVRHPKLQSVALKAWDELIGCPSCVVMDIGANYGEYTARAAGRAERVFSIEPNPWTRECLIKSFLSRGNVHVIDAAIGDVDGATEFHFNRTYSGGGSLSKYVIESATRGTRVSPYVSGRTTSVRVPVKTFKTLIADHVAPFARLVFKMDVEGYEFKILRNAVNALSGLSYWRGIVEFNPAAIAGTGEDPLVAWNFFMGFPRVRVLGQTPGPSAPPSDCDVIIGQGDLP